MCECTHEDKRWFWGTVSELGVEGWKDGRLEEGKIGRMEGWSVGCLKWDFRDWKKGGLEGWKGGRVACLKQDLQDSKDSQDYGVFLSENCAL